MIIRITAILSFGLILLSMTGPLQAQEIDKLVVLPIRDRTEQPTGGLETLKQVVGKYFGKSRQVVILTKEQFQAVLDSATGSRLTLAQSVAEKMDSNGMLIVTLERYRQRVGSEFSATDPASLAFNFRLFKTPEDKLVCSGRYDETQQSLAENILDFSQARKRGFKWITVEDMTEKAVRNRFDKCQDLKDKSSIK
ncbi:MAG: hypothetical protein ABFQ82_02985 [Thermodesulfobacteriota bacterium]